MITYIEREREGERERERERDKDKYLPHSIHPSLHDKLHSA